MSDPYTMARDTQTKGITGVGGSGWDGKDLGRKEQDHFRLGGGNRAADSGP